MKIFKDNAVFVQKNDIGFLSESDLSIPYSIFMKVFEDGITVIDDSNRFQFVKFDDELEVDFFRKLDWIIDYNLVKDLSEKQIKSMMNDVLKDKRKLVLIFINMTDEQRKLNSQIVDEWFKLEYKYFSLEDILKFKKGHIKMLLPEGVSYPNIVEEKGIKRLIRKVIK